MRAAPAPASVADYLAEVAPIPRSVLARYLREVRRMAPDVEERISYGMPTFRLNGRPLVYLAAFRDHLSFFPASATTRAAFAKELAPFVGGKGTVRFTSASPLPMPLFRRVVRRRIAENRARPTPGRRNGRPTASGPPGRRRGRR